MVGAGKRGKGRAAQRVVPDGKLARSRLESLLDDGTRRRLVTVIADAGFGKSTLLGSWSAKHNCAWHSVRAERTLTSMVAGLVDALQSPAPEAAAAIAGALQGPRGPEADAMAYAAAVAEALEKHLATDLVLIVDDVQELSPGEPATRLLEGLVRVAPAALHLVLCSRTGLPFGIDRLRGRGQVMEIEGPELAFTVDETSALLETVLGDGTADLAEPLQTAVRGWPAATRLAVEAMRSAPGEDRLGRVLRPDGPLYDYLAQEIFAAEPADVRRLVSVVAGLPRFGTAICEALGLAKVAETIAELNTRGLLVPANEQRGVVSDERESPAESYELNPLVRDFALARMPLEAAERPDIGRRAGEWFEQMAADRDALACYLGFGDTSAAANLLRTRGEAMIVSGAAEAVVRGIEKLQTEKLQTETTGAETTGAETPGAETTGGADGRYGLERVEGEARQVLGDWEGAQRCFDRMAGREGPIPAGVAYRSGLIHHLRGYYDAAITTYQRGTIDGSEPVDEALLQAWWAGAHWLRGEIDESRRLAIGAMAGAQLCGDDRALAAAHTALAMLAAVDSDPRGNATHYQRALAHAERAGDVLQSARIRVNRGSHHVSEGNYAKGIEELDIAIGLADLSGFAVYRALAMNNRGEALLRLGRLDEAIGELEASRAIYQRLESRRVSQPLANLGEVYRERGDLAMARACYEEAIATAGDMRDIQSLVPSLAGLARVLVEDEPDRAAELAGMARRAVSFGPVPGQSGALVALGWVTLHRGDHQEAAATADEAAALSRRRRDRAGLASALELKAAAEGHGLRPATSLSTAEQALLEALSIRREIGDPLGEARAELMLAQRSTGRTARDYAASAHEKFVAAGATRYAAAALLAAESSSPPPVRLECLGGFRILRDGQPVRLSEWPSKKARDLLKILVARRCHPIARPALIEFLWPDETDESALSGRLSVALSTVRSVLDPEKRYAADHFVGSDRSTVWLEADAVTIDVEEFLRDARGGLEAGRQGQRLLLLRAAEASYAGDFLEEDVYADWASGLRDEARAIYIRVARGLAEHAVTTDDHDAAAGYLLRILQRDPYDERAHLALVGSLVTGGAHGEARRAYRTYVLRMEELGVEPAPFPADRPVKAV